MSSSSSVAKQQFQMVIQFPSDFFESISAIHGFEERLMQCMPRTCNVDGHDVGSGTVNFFVDTTAPLAAFRTFRKYLGTNAVERRLRIAYRLSEGEDFTNLWPRRDPLHRRAASTVPLAVAGAPGDGHPRACDGTRAHRGLMRWSWATS
jgi:hypothetical protein